MNRIYKVIWSKVRNCYVVVSEIAKRHARSAAGRSRRHTAAVLAAGLVLAPLAYAPVLPEVNAASATNITDGGGNSLTESGSRVHELYAQQVTGANGLGISRYRDFTLAEKEIANMRFHERGKNVEALNLLNLVQNRVDINGTVNAIRGNKIDGGLYFLSSNGIAIGPTGVINAGSFTAMVPSEDYFDKLDDYAKDGDTAKLIAEFDNSIQEHDANNPFAYNEENGSNISIEGRINTRGVRETKYVEGSSSLAESWRGVMLGASKVDIATGAKITNNKAMDFSGLVNIKDGDGKVITNAGLDGLDFSAEKTANTVAGDITIKAYAESVATDSTWQQLFDEGFFENITDSTFLHKNTTRNAEINIDGAVVSDGAISVNASAKSTFSEGNLFNIFTMTGIIDKVLGQLGVDMMADWADKTNTSSITVGRYGSLNSEKATSLSTSSFTNVVIINSTPGAKTGDLVNKDSGKFNLPATAVAVAVIDNHSNIDVSGKISSQGNVSANAVATSISTVTNMANTRPAPGQAETDPAYISVGVQSVENAASVYFRRNEEVAEANTVEAKGDFSASATANTTITHTVGTTAPDGAFLATAVGVVDADSSANVQVDKDVTARNITINAKNSASDVMSVNMSIGSADPQENVKNIFVDPEPNASDVLFNALVKEIKERREERRKDKADDNPGSDAANNDNPGSDAANNDNPGSDAANNVVNQDDTNAESALKKFLSGDYIKIGAGVGVFDNTNTATVTVGDNAKLVAGESITINADTSLGNDQYHEGDADVTDLRRLNLQVTGTGNEQLQSTKALVAVGVLVGSIDNDSSVLIGKNATVSGKSVGVNSHAEMDYNPAFESWERFCNNWEGFWDALMAFENVVDDDQLTKKLGEVINALETDKAALDGQLTGDAATSGQAVDIVSMTANLDDMISQLEDLRDEVDGHYAEFWKAGSDIETLWAKLKLSYNTTLSQLDPASYTNFYTRSQISNWKDEDSSKLDISGSVNVHQLQNRASVISGEKSVIAAAAGDAVLSASTSTSTVALTGEGGKYGSVNTSGNTGVGVSVAVGDVTGDSLVMVGKDAEITAAQGNIKADTANTMTQTGVIYGAGWAKEASITGMVNLMQGETNAITSIDDEAVLTAKDTVAITASNDSTITGVTGGLTLGSKTTSAAVGAAVTVISYDVNTYAIVADNATDADAPAAVLTDAEAAQIEADVDSDITAGKVDQDARDAEIAIRKTALKNDKLKAAPRDAASEKVSNGVALAHKLAEETIISRTVDDGGNETTSYLDFSSIGTKTEEGDTGGAITAALLDTKATTEGTINSISLEGAVTTDGTGGIQAWNKATDGTQSVVGSLPMALTWPSNKISKIIGGEISGKPKEDGQAGGNDTPNSGGNDTPNSGGNDTPNSGGNDTPGPDEAGDNDTPSLDEELNNAAEEQNKQEKGRANLANNDQELSSKLHVDGAGSVSVNLLDGETAAIVDHTAVKSGDVKLTAEDSLFDGAWAGGAAVNWQTSNTALENQGSAKNVALGGAVALNSSARGVSSILRAATVEDTASIVSLAEKNGTDVAVALGVAVTNSGENSGLDLPIGASVSYNAADTNAYSLLIDNTVTGTGATTVTSEASLSDLQVAGGAGAGMSFGSNYTKSGAVGGTAAVSRIENDIESGILGGTYTNIRDMDLAATKSTNQVDAAVAGAISTEERSVGFAGAVAYSETDNTGRALLKEANVSSSGNIRVESLEAANANEYREYLQSLGVDPDGTAYMGENGSGQLGELSGSTIVNVALAGEYAGKGGAAVGVSVGVLENDIAAEVDSSITAKSVTAQTENKAEIIGVTLGASMGGDTFGGAGGVGWIDMENDSRVTFGKNSSITADTIKGNAVNDSDIVNVGGEAGISSKGSALGLNLVYNSMDNTTGAYAEGGTYNAPTVSLAAENNADIFGLSLGVSYSNEKNAFNGTIALTFGDNNTEAVFGTEEAAVKITGVKDLSVTAKDNTKKITSAGEVTVSGGAAAVGAAIAYAELGGNDMDDPDESLTAAIRNADITTAAGETAITVTAEDNSELVTTAVGAGVTYGDDYVNGQGAAAVTEASKDSRAEMTGTVIDTAGGGKAAGVSVTGRGKTKVTTTGVGASVSGGEGIVTAGAGLGITQLSMDITAEYSAKTLADTASNVRNLDVRAESDSDITGIAAGVSASGGSVSVTGSFTYNYIDNAASASVSKANVASSGSIGATAQSDERIAAYAGSASGSKNAAIGVAVALNKLKGDTTATVSDSRLSVASSGNGITVRSAMDDDAVIHNQADSQTFDPDALVDGRQSVTKKGVTVDASSTRAISSDLVSGGGVGTGAAVDGAVNLNYITGTTGAEMNAANVTGTGDVSVNAADYTNIGTFEVGGAGAGTGAAIGATENTNDIRRETRALVKGSSDTSVTAKDFNVTALSMQGISNLAAGGAGAGTGASIGFNLIDDRFNTKTVAGVEDATVKFSGASTVRAENESRAYMGTYSAAGTGTGAGAGLGIGLLEQDAETSASVTDSEISSSDSGSSLQVEAENTVKAVTWVMSAAGAGEGAGLAGSAVDADFTETTSVTVENSQLKADTIGVNAASNIDIANYGGDVGGAGLGGGVGVGVFLNNISETVSVTVKGSTLDAAKSLETGALARRSIDQVIVSVGGAAFAGIAVNYLENNINTSIDNDDLKTKIDYVNSLQGFDTGDFLGLDSDEAAQTASLQGFSASYGQEAAEGQGVHVNITDGSSLDADSGNISVTVEEDNYIRSIGGSASIGIGSVNTSFAYENLKRANGVTLDNAALTGKTIAVTAKNGNLGTTDKADENGIYATGFVGNAGGVAVDVLDTDVKVSGVTGVDVKDSTVIATDAVSVAAEDGSSLKTEVVAASVGIVNVACVDTDVVNESAVSAALTGTNNLTAENTLSVGAANRAVLTAASISASLTGIGEAYNSASAEDTSAATVTVSGSNTVTAGNADFTALNAPVLTVEIDNDGGGIYAGFNSFGEATLSSGAAVTVEDGNTFKTNALAFDAKTGESGATTLDVDVASVSVSGIGGNLVGDHASATSAANAVTTVGSQAYYGKDGSGNKTDLSITAENDVSSRSRIFNVNAGVIEVSAGSVKGQAERQDTVTVSAAGGSGANVMSLTLAAVGNSYVDNDTEGSGGGIADVGNMATAESVFDNIATANLQGAWNVSGKADISASQNDAIDYEAFSGSGGAVDVTGVSATLTMKGSAAVNLVEGTVVNAGSINVTAKNSAGVNRKDVYDYNVHGVIGAVRGYEDVKSDVTVDRASAVTVGENSSVTAQTGNQVYEAYTDAQVTHRVQGTTGGIIDSGNTRLSTNITNSDTIDVKTGASLTNTIGSTGSITFAAHDDIDAVSDAEATTTGILAFVANADVDAATTRNNIITINGSLDSNRDVNLYAGAGTDGVASNMYHNLVAEAYNYSVIPSTSPDVTHTVTESGQVIVGSDAVITTTGDIIFAAHNGKESIKTETKAWRWAGGEDDDVSLLGSTNGNSNYGQTTDNFVQIDGTITAGARNKITVAIDGQMVPDSANIQGTDNSGSYAISVKDANDNEMEAVKKEFKTGTFDYGNELSARWYELTELINVYQGKDMDNDDLEAYTGYVAERKSVEAQMDALGLMGYEKDAAGNTVKVPIAKKGETVTYDVVYVEVPDGLTASGGNINVTTDNLIGSGSLTANGSATVSVTNHSNAYLKVNGITLGGDGGAVVFNNANLSTEADHNDCKEINALNQDGEAHFKKVTVDRDGSKAAITIENEYNGGDIAVVDKENAENTDKYQAVSTVEIAGVIDAGNGTVTITNESGSVNIDSGTMEHPVSVTGASVKISANGSFSTGYISGIYNIGGAPETVYANFAADREKEIDLDTLNQDHKKLDKSEQDLSAARKAYGYTPGSVVSGGSITIAASDINVNGLIQSGFNTYSAEVSEADLSATQSAVQRGGTADHPAVQVNGKTMYKVNAGGITPGSSSGANASYTVQVYYDPEENKLVTENISTQGGQVTLIGRIVNTSIGDYEIDNVIYCQNSDGRIVAADGGADITIVNNTSLPLELGRVVNNDLKGTVDITDTLKGEHTVITSNTTYYPKTGARYNWTDGTATSTTRVYEEDETKFLNIWTTGDDEREAYEAEHDPVTVKLSDGDALKKGAYMSEKGRITNKDGVIAYRLTADNVVQSEERSETTTWTDWHFLNKHYYSQWSVTTGTKQTYVHSLAADNGIDIEFIGKSNGTISVNSNGGVIVNGDIRGNSTASALNVNSAGGSISQTDYGSIRSNDVSLTANGDITGIRVDADYSKSHSGSSYSDTPVKVTAVSETGDVALDITGSDVEVRNIAAGIGSADTLAADTYGTKNISLTTQGDIIQNDDEGSYGIKGSRIDITTAGAVGSLQSKSENALLVQTAQAPTGSDTLSTGLNVTAQGDINIAQNYGDMRIGRIESAKGEVQLAAYDGRITDALPHADDTGETDLNAKARRWADAGVIADSEVGAAYEGSNTKFKKQAVANYEEGVRDSWTQYEKRREYYEDAANQDENDSNYRLYKKLAEQFKGYSSADEYLAAQKDTEGSRYATMLSEAAAAAPWTRDMMLYTLRDAIVNKKMGSTDAEGKAANIIAKEITLKSAKGIGEADAGTENIRMEWLKSGYTDPETGKTNVDYLKELANANTSDITVNYDSAGNIESFDIREVSPIGVYGRKNSHGYPGTIVTADSISVKEDVEAGDYDIFIASRPHYGTGDSKLLTLDEIKTKGAGNVRILGKEGVQGSGDKNIVGGNLLVEGGTGSITLETKLSGTLTARAEGDISINDVESLKVGAVYSPGNVSLNAWRDVYMSEDADPLAYINAGTSLELGTDGGSIGTEERPIRVLANGVPVSLNCGSFAQYIHVLGVADRNPDAALNVVNSIRSLKTVLESEGDLRIGNGNEEDYSSLSFPNDKLGTDYSGPAITLNAGRDLYLEGGVYAYYYTFVNGSPYLGVEALNHLPISLSAGRDIIQNVGGVSASELTVSAGRNIQLENDLNRFHSVVVNGTDGIVTGDVNIASHALSVEYGYPSEVPPDDNNLYVTVNAGIAGEQSFTNLDGGGVDYKTHTVITGANYGLAKNLGWRFGSHVGNDDINWLTNGVLSIEPHMMHRMDSNFRLGTGLVFYSADDLLSYSSSAGEGEVEEEKSVRNALPGEIIVVP